MSDELFLRTRNNGRKQCSDQSRSNGRETDILEAARDVSTYLYVRRSDRSSSTRLTLTRFNSTTIRKYCEVVVRRMWSKLCEVNINCPFLELLGGPANQSDPQPHINIKSYLHFGELWCLKYSTDSLTNHRQSLSRTIISINQILYSRNEDRVKDSSFFPLEHKSNGSGCDRWRVYIQHILDFGKDHTQHPALTSHSLNNLENSILIIILQWLELAYSCFYWLPQASNQLLSAQGRCPHMLTAPQCALDLVARSQTLLELCQERLS
jgi:hypothetical protein